MKKIGLYSGSFDPIHLGHTAFIDAAIDQLGLETMYVLPEPKPRQKSRVMDINHRQKMLDIQFSDNKKVITKLDGLSDAHSTKETLKALNAKHESRNTNFYLLMGVDVFLNIDKWDDSDELIQNFEFAVALRTEDDGEELVYRQMDLPSAKVTKFSTDKATVSSSKIREEINQGIEPKDLSSQVYGYIKSNNLYLS